MRRTVHEALRRKLFFSYADFNEVNRARKGEDGGADQRHQHQNVGGAHGKEEKRDLNQSY